MYDTQQHNLFHIVLDSVALAGLLHSVLNIKDISTIRPDDDSEDQLPCCTAPCRISSDGYTHLYLPLQAEYLCVLPLNPRQVVTGWRQVRVAAQVLQ